MKDVPTPPGEYVYIILSKKIKNKEKEIKIQCNDRSTKI